MSGRNLIRIVSPAYGCQDSLRGLVDAVFASFDGTYLMWHLRGAIAIIIRFTHWSIDLCVLLGVTFSDVSALFFSMMLITLATGACTMSAWMSLILPICTFSGLILSVLGLHGFNIGCVFVEIQNWPWILINRRIYKGEPTP